MAAAIRVIVPRWKLPKAPKAPTKQLTHTERNGDYRARKTTEERDTSAKWLQLTIDDPDQHQPGTRVPAATLYAEAKDAITDWVDDFEDDRASWREDAEDDGVPMRPRVPGSKTFYAVADDMLGPGRRVQGVRMYVMPEAPLNLTALDRALIDRTAEILADRIESRMGVAADTSTDRSDNVIPLRRAV
ncbi:hypothetical protein [Streptomyces sp. NPDC054756]